MLALVGESGSGKTMVARSVLGLMPPPMLVTGGRIRFEGTDLTQLRPRQLARFRGSRIGMIFQEPRTSLNPALPIGLQLEEALRLHLRLGKAERRRRIIEMLDRVKIADPEA